MKWFKKSNVGQNLAQSCSPLQNEIDVVPKTEFSASRQTLNNINIALYGESSEAPGKEKYTVEDAIKTECENKCCCGGCLLDSHDDLTDYGYDEAIKNYKNSKSTFINLRSADNNAHASKGSSSGAVIETDCRRSSLVMKEIKNADYVIYFAPLVMGTDTSQIDKLCQNLIEYPTVRN